MEDFNLTEMYSDLQKILNDERREIDAYRDAVNRDREKLLEERGRLKAVIEAAERGGVSPAILKDLRRIERTIAGIFDF